MSLFLYITIAAVVYLAIGGAVLGYFDSKKYGKTDDAEVFVYLFCWPLLIALLVIGVIIYFPVKFGEWVYDKTKWRKKK